MKHIDHVKLVISDLLWSLPKANFKSDELAGVANSIITDGCCIINNYLSDDESNEIYKATEVAYEKYSEFVAHESNGSDKRIYGIDRLDGYFKLSKVFSLPNLISKKFEIGFDKTWFQLLGNIEFTLDNLGSGSGWHRDSPFRHQFKAILYLTDVVEENGPFEYVKGSHTTKSLKESARFLGLGLGHYRFTDEQIASLERSSILNKRTAVLGKKGTLLMADVRGLHRGRPLSSGNRRALTRYYYSHGIPKHLALPRIRNTIIHDSA